MIERTFDVEFVNRVLNHPEVRPSIGPGPEVLNAEAWLSNPMNIALATEHGVFLLDFYSPGVYEVHTQFLPDGRGRHAVDAMQAGLHWMFVRTDCMELLTRVCRDNKAAAWLTERAGFRKAYERDSAAYGPSDYFYLTYQDWAARAPGLPEAGKWFHEHLEALRGSPPGHDEDPAHDRYVGAAVEMMMAGNYGKAINLYNRWARMSEYCPLQVVGVDPLVLHVGDGLVRIQGNTFDIPEESWQPQQQ